jgi:hypothetical protein
MKTMKRILFSILATALLSLGSGETLKGQPLPGGTPPGLEQNEDKRHEKTFRDFHEKEGRRLRPEPILMAGDARFQQMLLLALTPAERVEEKLKSWPLFVRMSGENQERMKKEIEGFRNRIYRTALKNAEESGLALTETRKSDYVKRYWERRSQVETILRQEVQGRLKTAMDQENDALKKEFSP